MMAATKNTKAFYNTEIPSDWEVKELKTNKDKYIKKRNAELMVT